MTRSVAWATLCGMSDTFLWSKTGVPSLWYLMPDELRWSWCDNNRNKVNNKCNALESSQNYPSTLVRRKTVFREIGPWPQKWWQTLELLIFVGWLLTLHSLGYPNLLCECVYMLDYISPVLHLNTYTYKMYTYMCKCVFLMFCLSGVSASLEGKERYATVGRLVKFLFFCQ